MQDDKPITTYPSEPQADELIRFILENTQVRGEWVHLDHTWQTLLDCANYPDSVKQVLGEALAAICLLSATIKYQGSLMLQINGEGPLHLLLVQATSEGTVRGLARWQEDKTEAVTQAHNLETLFSKGHIVITIEPRDQSEQRYQGVVALEGERLTDSLTAYFEQSEQLKTRLWLAADDKAAAGMLLQRLPGEAEDEDGWQRSLRLAETMQDNELLTLGYDTLLHRLFHQESIRLFDTHPMQFKCTCSQGRVNDMVHSLGKDEASAIVEEKGSIDVTCEFCNTQYSLDAVDVHQLFDTHPPTTDSSNPTLH